MAIAVKIYTARFSSLLNYLATPLLAPDMAAAPS